jgi:ABC-type maltose transport system permease subunit
VLLGHRADAVGRQVPHHQLPDQPARPVFTDYNLLSAGSVVIAIPGLIIFFLLQKQFVAGLTLGSTKG